MDWYKLTSKPFEANSGTYANIYQGFILNQGLNHNIDGAQCKSVCVWRDGAPGWCGAPRQVGGLARRKKPPWSAIQHALIRHYLLLYLFILNASHGGTGQARVTYWLSCYVGKGHMGWSVFWWSPREGTRHPRVHNLIDPAPAWA